MATEVTRRANGALTRNRNFSLLWGGQLVSQLGDRLAMVAFPWLVYKATGSALSTGAILALYTLPYVLFGAVAGVAIDRFNKRHVMIVADVVRAALVVMVPFAANRSLASVFALGFLTASVAVFFDPCKLSLLPDIVTKEQLLRANSLLATTETLTEVVGYAAAGIILASISLRSTFIIDGGTFLVSALALTLIAYAPPVRAAAERARRSVGREIREGLTFLGGHGGLLTNTVLVVTAMIGFGVAYPLTFLFAVRILHGGTRAFGVMEAAIGLGFLAGSIALAGLAHRAHKGLAIAGGLAVMGAGLASVAATGRLFVTILPLFLVGLANAAALISIDTYFQETVPEHLRGRVWGVRFTLSQGVYAASVLAGGALAGAGLSIRALFVAAGLVVAIPALVGLLLPAVRDI